MTERSYPQQGIAVGDATLAPYSADIFALHYLASLTGFGRRADYGALKGYDNGVNFGLQVTQTAIASASVELKVGAGIVTGTLYENDATLTLAVAANSSGNPRVDTVILRKDYTLQTVRAVVKQGSPAATPTPPALTQTATTWEIPIADINVANGFSTLADAVIFNRQQWANVGDSTYIDGILNNSGADLEEGDVVIWDNTALRSVTTTTSPNHSRIAGVWDSRLTANGAAGRLMTRGYKQIRVKITNTAGITLTASIGQILVTGDTVKKATVIDASSFSTIIRVPLSGVDLATGSVNTGSAPAQVGILQQAIPVTAGASYDNYAWARIDVQQQRNSLYVHLYEIGSTAGGGTFTSGAFRTRTLDRLKSGMDLQTATTDTGNAYVALSANVFTLQPGRYHIRARAPAYRVDAHQPMIFCQSICQSVSAYGPESPTVVPFQGIEIWVIQYPLIAQFLPMRKWARWLVPNRDRTHRLLWLFGIRV